VAATFVVGQVGTNFITKNLIRTSNFAPKLLLLHRVLRRQLISQKLVCLALKTCLGASELLEYSREQHTNLLGSLGVDSSALAPRYINMIRGQIICCIIGGWCMVPWKVLVSGPVFLSCITGMGIFMGCLVSIMLADYLFVRKRNYFIEDLYTSDPNGRY
jgi:hypothetical protein